MFKYYVCDENGDTLYEFFNESDAMENCNYFNGEFVSRRNIKDDIAVDG